MSSMLGQITRHPISGQYELADWIDDYFGQHIYGVRFPSDDKYYPVDHLPVPILHYWSDDVQKAFRKYLHTYHAPSSPAEEVKFLNLIEEAYKERWEDDPITGHAATMPDPNTKL